MKKKVKRISTRKKSTVIYHKNIFSFIVLGIILVSIPLTVFLSQKKQNTAQFADTTELHSCTKQQADNGTPGTRSCDAGNGCKGTQYHQYYSWEDKNGNDTPEDSDSFTCTWSSCVAPFSCPAGVSPNPPDTSGPGNPIGGSNLGVQLGPSNPLDRLKRSNYKDVGWVKYQYPWADPAQPVEKWAKDAKKAGYKVLISIAKRPGGMTADAAYGEFEKFTESLAKRLGGDVDAYEIWNEPNLMHEWQGFGEINPQNYVKLLQAGYKGIKKGNSNAKVISSGLAPFSGEYNDEKFFNEFVQAGGLNYLDAVGWHSNITKNIPPSDTSLDGFQRVKIALKSGKPVWLTEFGWARDMAGISRDTQDKYIKEAHELAPKLGNIEVMIIWNFGFTNEGIDPGFAQWDVERALPTPTPTPLPAPINLKASCKVENKALTLTFTWNKVDKAARYAIRVDKDPGTWGEDHPNKGDTVKNDVMQNSYKRCGSGGAKYVWWVHSVDTRGVYSQKAMGSQITCATLTPVPTCRGVCQQTFVPTEECKD